MKNRAITIVCLVIYVGLCVILPFTSLASHTMDWILFGFIGFMCIILYLYEGE